MFIKPPIFIGGAGRSGTTLLRVILDSHPNIACGPELKISPVIAQLWYDFRTMYLNIVNEYFITQEDINQIFAQMIFSLLEKYLSTTGKKRIAEKTPNNIRIFKHLHEMFPDSPLIHLIRDGRDVVASLLSMDWKTPMGEPIEYTKDVKKAARFWLSAVTAGRKFAEENSSSDKVYLEIRYEDIVNKSEECLKKLFNFIDEPWDSSVLRYYKQERNLAGESSAKQVSQKLFTSAIGRWKKDLTKEQKEEIKPIAGELLIKLGYAKDLNW